MWTFFFFRSFVSYFGAELSFYEQQMKKLFPRHLCLHNRCFLYRWCNGDQTGTTNFSKRVGIRVPAPVRHSRNTERGRYLFYSVVYFCADGNATFIGVFFVIGWYMLDRLWHASNVCSLLSRKSFVENCLLHEQILFTAGLSDVKKCHRLKTNFFLYPTYDGKIINLRLSKKFLS